MIKYFDKPKNLELVCKSDIYDIVFFNKYLPNVIAVDVDDNYYRFYLQDFNPKIINDVNTLVLKPDGQIGTLGLPYTFNKENIYKIMYNGNTLSLV